MLDQLKSRGRKQNVIQPGCDFPPSGIVCVYHRHVLVPAELSQALSVVVRFHLVILSTACHDFAFQVQCLLFRVSHIRRCAFKSPPTTMQHRDGAAFTTLSAQSKILSVAQSPIGGSRAPSAKDRTSPF